ncbi:MAG: inorganic phosphate transporter [Planctomycetota bacterium]
MSSLSAYHLVVLILAVGLLIWDAIEVGRNDAANLVNAVLGARVLRRGTAILLVGVAVVIGAVMGSDVIDTARKGIFDPNGLGTLEAALAVYISVYIIDTVLLYSYSAFGMPVSTTALLVFELLGAAAAINVHAINWDKAGTVLIGILFSIVISGFASFLLQRAARGAIRTKVAHFPTLLLHGGWIGGGLAAGLSYFLLLKGMKNVESIRQFRGFLVRLDELLDAQVSLALSIILLWGFFGAAIHIALIVFRQKAARLLFPSLAVLGMIAMGFAFGQNDLANCASPGLASIQLLKMQDLNLATKVSIPQWMLLVCGLLLFFGMTTKNAARVTKAAISTGSMDDHVALWAPGWCLAMARKLLRWRGEGPALAPRPEISRTGKATHYDTLRACVITSVSASVIATASSLGLPVSTTYVAFAAVVATGAADRIFQRGDAELKLGRAIWVVASWIISALVAAAATFLVTLLVYQFAIAGMAACLALNFLVRRFLRTRADRQTKRVEEEAYERAHPDEFALEQEDV